MRELHLGNNEFREHDSPPRTSANILILKVQESRKFIKRVRDWVKLKQEVLFYSINL